MKVEIEHVEAGHAATLSITTDTGVVVSVDVGNAWDPDGATLRVEAQGEVLLETEVRAASPNERHDG